MDPKLRSNLRRERKVKLGALFAVLGCAIAIAVFTRGMLLSLVIAFVINYLIAPFVNLLERKGVSRQFAILLPFAATLGALALGIWKIAPLVAAQVASLDADLPAYQRDFVRLLASAEARFHGIFKYYGVDVSQTANVWIVEKTTELSTKLPSILSESMTVAMLAPFFAFFMLQDGRRISKKILAMVPNDLFEVALRLHHQINDQLGGFVRARFLEAAIVGAVVFIGLRVVSFPYAALLALFAAATNLIPYLGPIIGAVPAILIALLSAEAVNGSSLSFSLIAVATIYSIAQLIDVLFVIPLVVARIVNLHPVTVIIVIIVGAEIMGVLGMMISIPVASVMKLAFSAFYEHLTEFRS